MTGWAVLLHGMADVGLSVSINLVPLRHKTGFEAKILASVVLNGGPCHIARLASSVVERGIGKRIAKEVDLLFGEKFVSLWRC